jgi:hypothetical protein
MPCYDPTPRELEEIKSNELKSNELKSNELKSLENQINKLEAMLCAILSTYFEENIEISYEEIEQTIKNYVEPNTKDSGISMEDIAEWYYNHREKDRLRRKKEAEIFKRAETEAKEFLKTIDPKIVEAMKRIINDV